MNGKAAENQHYVPKIILRQFLSNERKERVTVYDMQDNLQFVTHIKNVMAERRFNEFMVDDNWRASFEPASWRVEEQVKPTYEQIKRDRRLPLDALSLANISTMLAFQFLRTKAHRQRLVDFEEMLLSNIEQTGHSRVDLVGYEPPTEDRIKKEHLDTTAKWLRDFSVIMSEKVFLLAEPAPGRSFYLGDNPVVLHNRNSFGPFGNLGLQVRGIEIYLPLSADLLLCAWCPSILAEIRSRHKENLDVARMFAVGSVMKGRMSVEAMNDLLVNARREDGSEDLMERIRTGTPVSSNDDNMDYYNSLQATFADRYVIDKQENFDIARRVAADKRAGKSPLQVSG